MSCPRLLIKNKKDVWDEKGKKFKIKGRWENQITYFSHIVF